MTLLGSPIIGGFNQETRSVIDVMTRLKIHNMAEGGVLQAAIAAKCGVGLRSVERILTVSARRTHPDFRLVATA